MTIRRRLTGLLALLLLAGILLGTPALLLAVAPILRWPTLTGLDDIGALLLRPDDGSLALILLWLLAWIAWAILALAFVVEIIARLARTPVPQLRPIAGPQAVIRGMVAAAATLFITASSVQAAGPAQAAPVAARIVDEVAPVKELVAESAEQVLPTYTVRPGDSLWSIAKNHLGAGERYPEIVALNPDKLTRPDFLNAGWTLTLPASAPLHAQPGSTYVVKKGDTLAKIAGTQLGDPARYPEIFEASASTTQPDGGRLTNPDLIRPGWVLTVGQAAPVTSDDHASGSVAGTLGTDDPADANMARQPVTPPPEVPDTTDGTVDMDEIEAEEETVPPVWLLVGLTGAGAGLAGSLYALLRHRRALQHRARRPGRSIALPPPELAPVEKTILAEGARSFTAVEMLDQALRCMVAQQVASALPVPTVAAVEQGPDWIALYLAEPCEPAGDWQTTLDQLRWIADEPDEAIDPDLLEPDAPAPYPQLVTIGAGDGDTRWLLNLEVAGIINLTGHPQYVDDFIRFIVAELGANPWSRDVHVDCIKTSTELDGLEPRRLHFHTDAEPAIRDLILDTHSTLDRLTHHKLDSAHQARAEGTGDDLWDSRMLIIGAPDVAVAAELVDLIDGGPVAGTSIILIDSADATVGEPIELTPDGRLRMPGTQLDIEAAGLTPDEAHGINQLLETAEDWDDQPIPPLGGQPGTWQANVDQAGHLLADLTIPREDAPPTGAVSLLPEPDAAYLAVADTTEDDLVALAPYVPPALRKVVDDADPDLDADLARWRDDPDTPKLSVLGPLTARVGRNGQPSVIAKRRAFYTEMLAYLATRTNGATTEEVAEAFELSTNRVRKDISVLRTWLGTNPRTNARHLPDANQTQASKRRGQGAYEIEGLLLDADLFRRLRARGEARGGKAGIADLRAALDLVRGEPFGGLKGGGRPWFADGPRLDQQLVYAVVDVAHTLATHDLSRGDHANAEATAQRAAQAAPDEKIPVLDLAAARRERTAGWGQRDAVLGQGTADTDGESSERTLTTLRSLP